MKIIKGITLGFVGFFLFVTLPCLGLFITLNNTILNPNFIVKEIEKLGITEVAREYIKTQLPSETLPYASAIDDALTQEKPWINQNIKQLIISSYDFLFGATDELRLSFSLGEVKQNLTNNFTNAILSSPPSDYQRLSPKEKDQYLLNLKAQIQNEIPSNYELEVNQDLIGQDNMNALQQIKNIIGYFRTSFWILICFIGLIILSIALIQREIRGIARMLGIVFLVDGALCGISYFVLKLVIPSIIPSIGLPIQVTTWLTVFVNDLLSPFGLFNLVILVIGAICLTVSLMIKGNPGAVSEMISNNK